MHNPSENAPVDTREIRSESDEENEDEEYRTHRRSYR